VSCSWLFTIIAGKAAILPVDHEPTDDSRKGTLARADVLLDPLSSAVFALITLLSLWFVYRTVRLDGRHHAGVGHVVGEGHS
jgi:hypothetical protein